MATHSSILAPKFHGQRNLGGYTPQGHKELNMTENLNLKIKLTVVSRRLSVAQ